MPYTRCATEMPSSDISLEELMFRILGDFFEEGFVAKLTDELYCGVNTIGELLSNCDSVLHSLQNMTYV